MNIPRLLAPCLLVIAACYSHASYPTSEYGDDLAPLPVLQGASGLVTDWTAPGGGGSSSYMSGSSFRSKTTFAGDFTCNPSDLEALAGDVARAFEDDIFGDGFQLVGKSEIKLGKEAGPGRTASILITFKDPVESGTLRIDVDTTSAADRFDYTLSVEEESR